MATVLQAQIISSALNSSGSLSAGTVYTVGANKYAKVTVAINFTASGGGAGQSWNVLVNGVIVLTVTAAPGAFAYGVIADIDLGAGATLGFSTSGTSGTASSAYTISGVEYQNSNYP
jgi:hypothetical protein